MYEKESTINRIELNGVITSVRGLSSCGKSFVLDAAERYTNICGGSRMVSQVKIPVTAFQSKDINLDNIKEGQFIRVMGRLRSVEYISKEGTPSYYTEIIARQIS